MKLTKKSWLVRVAYVDRFVLKDPGLPIPSSTNLCDLMARAIFIPPAFALFLAVFAVIACPVLAVLWVTEKIDDALPRPRAPRVISQWFEDWRERKCTKVEIE